MGDYDLAVVGAGMTEPGGEVALRLLNDWRARAIVFALADGPRRPSELERLPGIARSTLYIRLSELTSVGVVIADRLTSFPLRMVYRLSDSGRISFASELLIKRRHRNQLTYRAARTAGLFELTHLLAPIARLAPEPEGICELAESDTPRALTPTVHLTVARGAMVCNESPPPPARCTHVLASPQAWDDALLLGLLDGLEIVGDASLARGALIALGRALRV